mmetsp:Transcript_32218/g.78577  ORF Transcript_32218/g.78577 Transcript_32218/m.78577 type:complete len:274 (-) Transcript_32218:1460-2281(-)
MSNSNNKTSWLNYKKKEMNPHFCSRSMVTPLLRWKAAVTSASASAGVSAGGVGGFVGGIRHIAILPSSQQLPRQLQQQLCDNNGTATATATTTTIRSKHSSTQIKRLFKKNPAKRRVALKKNMNETTTSSSSTVVDGNSSAGGGVIPEPQFAPVVESPKFLPNGWCPLPSDDASAGSSSSSKYPFRVSRTGNKPQDSVGFLPVYSEYRCVFRKERKRKKILEEKWFACFLPFSSQVCFVFCFVHAKLSTNLSICMTCSPALSIWRRLSLNNFV